MVSNKYIATRFGIYSTRAKISHLVASLSTSRQQVVFALLVSSCQQVWKNLTTVITNLTDLVQGGLLRNRNFVPVTKNGQTKPNQTKTKQNTKQNKTKQNKTIA